MPSPVRIHVCDHQGICLRVSTDFALNLEGSVIQIDMHNVNDFVGALYTACDELENDAYYLPDRSPGAFSEAS